MAKQTKLNAERVIDPTPAKASKPASPMALLKAKAVSLYQSANDGKDGLLKNSHALQAMIPELIATGSIDKVLFGSDTALTFACVHLDLASIHALLTSGASPNATTQYRQSPMMQVLHGEHSWSKAEPCMQALLAAGADIHHRNEIGQQAIHWAGWSEKHSLDITRWLISKGADPSAPCDDGVTPLHDAAKLGKLAMVKFLLDAGADPFCKADANGKKRNADSLAMAMMWYPMHYQLDVVSLLTQVNISAIEKNSLDKAIKPVKTRKGAQKPAPRKKSI